MGHLLGHLRFFDFFGEVSGHRSLVNGEENEEAAWVIGCSELGAGRSKDGLEQDAPATVEESA
ncbi:MAG: hypothetical protein KGQ87_05765, partial [Verrucomicrobia bacterium]|nr:hypothetical protein [Verrucomicrobiota bacterium]